MTHLVVLGTSHPIQCGHSDVAAAAVAALEAELRTLVAKHSVSRIAEEMSTDGLTKHGVTETVAERIARELKIKHQYVELTLAERSSLGMTDAPVFTIQKLYRLSDCGESFRTAMSVLDGELRERIWTHRILGCTSSPVLFICGSSHVEPINRIWSLLGMKCDIAHYDFEA